MLALAALSTGYVALLTRAEPTETLASPFVHAARGLRTRRIVAVHALEPALIPVVTFVAANITQLFVGLFVVEGILGMPGLGGTLFEAIRDRDRSLLVGMFTVVMAAVTVANANANANAVLDVAAAVRTPTSGPPRRSERQQPRPPLTEPPGTAA